jgi:hypothetical protein
MAKLIRSKRVLELLDECVAEKGADYVYSTEGFLGMGGACMYVHSKGTAATDFIAAEIIHREPGCIVGHVLHKPGVSLEAMSDCGFEGDDVWGIFPILKNQHGIAFTNKAKAALSVAQAVQDDHTSWGDAVRSAKDVIADERTWRSEMRLT